MDITSQALLLYTKYLSLSEQYVEVKNAVSLNACRVCDCEEWARVTLNRFNDCIKILQNEVDGTYHVTLFKTALAEMISKGNKKRFLRYLNWFVEHQKMPSRDPIVQLSPPLSEVEQDPHLVYLAVDPRLITDKVWRDSYSRLFRPHTAGNARAKERNEEKRENKEGAGRQIYGSKKLTKSPRERHKAVLISYYNLSLFNENIVLTMNYDKAVLCSLERSFLRYVDYLKTREFLIRQNRSHEPEDVYDEIMISNPGLLEVKEEAFVSSITIAERVINNVQRGGFPGNYSS